MKVEEIAEAVAKLPPDQLARFRRWFTAFEAGRANHDEELDSAATKLGRLAGRAFAELKRRERIVSNSMASQVDEEGKRPNTGDWSEAHIQHWRDSWRTLVR
jgi:hypothetical protein